MLEERIRGHNHVLLTGQRRMGKTSILQELGRRLGADGWIFLFVDVEGATCPEDAIADIAQSAYGHRSIRSRLTVGMKRWFGENVEEVGVRDVRLKVRAGLSAGSWRRHGERLLTDCAQNEDPVLLVIDELPIFLNRMLRRDGNAERVDGFLSWLRSVPQTLGDKSPVLIVSGSIGLEPLVRRLDLPDRINYLYPLRLGPWNRDTSVACFDRLAASRSLSVDDGVAAAVYEAIGVGIPYHVQSFFARLKDFAIMQGRPRITVEDVADVYSNELLGPSGQSDLAHYETRLKEGMDDENYRLAMEILAEAATQKVFTPSARRCLAELYSTLLGDAEKRVVDTLDVLLHDGYLEAFTGGHRFASRLLGDWWKSRFRDHHVPLERRREGAGPGEPAQ